VKAGSKRAALIGSLFAALILSTTTASSASIAGTKCSKVSATKTVANVKYTCIKSGKKLIWNKGVAIKATTQNNSSNTTAAKPEPSPSPANTTPTNASQSSPTNKTPKVFQPWDTQVNAKELSDAAQVEFKKWVATADFGKANHKLIVQDGVQPSRLKLFSAADELGAKFFSQFFEAGSVTVIGREENWVVTTLNSNGGKFNSCKENAGDSGLNYCLDTVEGRQGFVVTLDAFYNPSNPAKDGSTLLAHEYFHSVQAKMLKVKSQNSTLPGDTGANKKFPIWLIEGSANFVGFSLVAHLNNATYWEGYESMLGYKPTNIEVNGNTLQDYEVRTCCGNDKPTYPYVIGQLASQYLIASIGFDKFLDLWRTTTDTEMFDDTFQRVTGISKSLFYERFESLRSNIGLPTVTKRLVCVQNSIVNKDISALTEEEKLKKFDANECLYGPVQKNPNSQSQNSNSNPDNLLEQACINLGEEKTTFYLWVCVNDKTKGKIWIRKGTESQYQLTG
jgi:hypothetical protein